MKNHHQRKEVPMHLMRNRQVMKKAAPVKVALRIRKLPRSILAKVNRVKQAKQAKQAKPVTQKIHGMVQQALPYSMKTKWQ